VFDALNQRPFPIVRAGQPHPARLTPAGLTYVNQKHDQIISLMARDMASNFKNFWGRRFIANIGRLVKLAITAVLGPGVPHPRALGLSCFFRLFSHWFTFYMN
jgi:hypothetical protein